MIMVVGISVAIVVVVVLGIVILVAMRKKPSAPMVLGAAQGGVVGRSNGQYSREAGS